MNALYLRVNVYKMAKKLKKVKLFLFLGVLEGV